MIKLIKRIKLLFIKGELVDFVGDLNKNYNLVKEKQKNTIPEKMENLDRTIQVMHTRGIKEGFNNDFQKGRTCDVALKLMFITYNSDKR